MHTYVYLCVYTYVQDEVKHDKLMSLKISLLEEERDI